MDLGQRPEYDSGPRGASVTNDRNRRNRRPDRRASNAAMARVLPVTADASEGASNLATQPRAGNISRDTRAGTLG